MSMRFLSIAVLALAFAATIGAGGPALADPAAQDSPGAWLEQPLAQWNQAGAPIPPAPPSPDFVNPSCAGLGRYAETPQDQALVDAGWHLFGPYRAGWGIVAVDAESTYDGMCRPLGYQTFVFVDGTFAGTISPEPMNSRETGAGTLIGISDGGLTARFVRYAASDPLCCPSLGAVDVTYRVDRTPAGPVLVPASSYQEPR